MVEGGNAAVFSMVGRQAAMLSFNATFWLLAILFVTVVPFIVADGTPGQRRWRRGSALTSDETGDTYD